MKLLIPELSVVVLIGTSGSGKSTFARKHFLPTQILSSDTFRGYICDDENSLEHNAPTFEALHYMLAKRLEVGRLTVVDATNVQKMARASLIEIAEQFHALKVAIVVDTPEEVCHARNATRPDRQFGPHVVKGQRADLRRSIPNLKYERFHKIYFIKPEQMDSVEIEYEPSWSSKPQEAGPFDIIGDVHGCLAELEALLERLGWTREPEWTPPPGRRAIFLGDLVDRGPDSVGVLRLAMGMVNRGVALCVPGNHDLNLMRALGGKARSLRHGLAETLAAVQAEPAEFQKEVADFLGGLVSHLVVDGGQLCVAHAGMPPEMQGRGSKAVREFALYGETTGEIDEFGLPVRYEWAKRYRGKATVVYGHTPVPEPEWLNNTIDIDTGCCFGGKLTALKWPERELVSVQAEQVYAEPVRPLDWQSEGRSGQQEVDDLLELSDVLGRMAVETRLSRRITVREENAAAALEVMSRFATDPRWVVHLPPTMSPCATSEREGFLEYPTEAFDYYRAHGQSQVICQEKHMGSRTLIVACRSSQVAQERFGVITDEQGVILSRTGRRFFNEDLDREQILVRRIVDAFERGGVFEELESDWVVLDAELMPWSAKAMGLLQQQYAPVASAALQQGHEVLAMVQQLRNRGVEGAETLVADAERRLDAATRFRETYRRYCWHVTDIDDYRIAPFHILASEGRAHVDQKHLWHLDVIGRAADQDPLLLIRTPNLVVDLESAESVASACAWWEERVANGSEGMVVKPLEFIAHFEDKPIQPAIKCRGPEYLRIIYGPEYLFPENLARLRKRGLTRKRGLASREFALGVEALERFVRREPLRRVHECVFAILALESEPVDPAL